MELPVHRVRLEELRLRPPGRDPAVLEHDHLVGELDRREAVGDDDRRPALHHLGQPLADAGLGGRVHRRGRVVEDEDPRVDEDRARDREPLALTAGERDAALADHGLVAVRQGLDELVRLGRARRLLDLLVGRVGRAEGDVLADGRGEEERILRDHADLSPERPAGHVAHVDAVDEDPPRGRLVEARHERGEGRLPGAGVPDQRDRAAGREGQVDVLQDEPFRVVAEGDALEPDLPWPGRDRCRTRAVLDALGLVEHVEDALARRGRALRLPDPHPEAAERDDQHREEQVEEEELAERERAGDDEATGGEQDRGLRDHRQEREQRHVQRALPERAHSRVEDRSRRLLELRLPPLLLRERLHDVHTDDRLLGDRRDLPELAAGRRAGSDARRGCSGTRRGPGSA